MSAIKVITSLPSYTCSAVGSGDGRYRYMLGRDWEFGSPAHRLGFVMLNPSTADATEDDPTIRRCVGFAAERGFTGIRVVNLMSYRTPYPDRLPDEHMEAVGYPLAHHYYSVFKREVSHVIAAWGGKRDPRLCSDDYCDAVIIKCSKSATYKDVGVLGETKGGDPRHPLMLASGTPEDPWVPFGLRDLL